MALYRIQFKQSLLLRSSRRPASRSKYVPAFVNWVGPCHLQVLHGGEAVCVARADPTHDISQSQPTVWQRQARHYKSWHQRPGLQKIRAFFLYRALWPDNKTTVPSPGGKFVEIGHVNEVRMVLAFSELSAYIYKYIYIFIYIYIVIQYSCHCLIWCWPIIFLGFTRMSC